MVRSSGDDGRNRSSSIPPSRAWLALRSLVGMPTMRRPLATRSIRLIDGECRGRAGAEADDHAVLLPWPRPLRRLPLQGVAVGHASTAHRTEGNFMGTHLPISSAAVAVAQGSRRCPGGARRPDRPRHRRRPVRGARKCACRYSMSISFARQPASCFEVTPVRRQRLTSVARLSRYLAEPCGEVEARPSERLAS